MSRLRIFADHDPDHAVLVLHDADVIADRLTELGVRFERLPVLPLAHDAEDASILSAFRGTLHRLQREGGYRSIDVVRVDAGHPDHGALREKIVAEHSHDEDEVRFLIAGLCQFNLHIGPRVYELRCEPGDVVGVPGGVKHWFDVGPRPSFTAIRLFKNPANWAARYIGSGIAARFAPFDDAKPSAP